MLSLLKQDISSSFSDLWYRVGPTRPQLSTHARITLQAFGDGHVYIVEDPASGDFYRLSAAAYHFIGMLDGRRTVDEAWQACCVQLGDSSPTQRECIDLLSRLQFFGLLSGDQPLAADMIERRMSESRKRRRRRRIGGGISFTVPLVNPERMLDRLSYLLKPIFSRSGLAAYCVVVLIALYQILINRAALFSELNGLLDPTNLVYLTALFVVLRAWHELGHAAACKAMGGRCTEMGLMLVAFVLPFPYCDTSSAWRFPETYKRIIVSSGGMLFETFVASLAAIVWAHTTDEAPLLRTMLFNTMVISGVTTLVFNANPLLRYDGYFILSDLAGSANLAGRSQELSRFLLKRHVFNITSAAPPAVRDTTEFWVLLGYNLLATPYRVLVTCGIVLFLWNDQRYLTLGILVAIVAACMWLIWPLMKTVGYLVSSPQLLGRRARAMGISGAAAALVAILVGVIPFPHPTYATGLILPRQVEPIRPKEDGYVEQVLVRVGDVVAPGDLLLILRNPQVAAELERAKAEVSKAQSYSGAAGKGTPAEQAIAAARLAQALEILHRAESRFEALTIRASIAGRICPPTEANSARLQDILGRYVSRGNLIILVATTDDLVVRSLVADRDHAFVFGDRPYADVATSFRVRGSAGKVVPASITRAAPIGSHEVTLLSLTSAGGGEVLLDPRDAQHHTTLTPQFLVELTPSIKGAQWQPGLRTRVRFEGPAKPLAVQWYRKLQQYLADKVRA